ncbi:unnamed protein product [Caenorhabditis bovis]|uniref:Domain of unknown function DX domain-containing protein n=1 Tax=Caenorhabditis bovis TaxID=2654633 RepID=A0A8S1FDH1_9PELO|nr:unnamed protein product [Caenorhabditis bovis]
MNLYIGPVEACRRIVPYWVRNARIIDEYLIECDYAVHGDVGKFSEIFFEEYALPNNQVYPTFGKYGSSFHPNEASTKDEDRICSKLMGSFSDFGQHQFIRFNEDNSLKLSIPPSYFSQTKYVHTGIKKATNSTRSCGEFGNEVCNARRNLTASTIIITDGSNWQLTSAPFGQRSPMYCQSRYYNFDENGYCRSDFTPFIKGNYMACHKIAIVIFDASLAAGASIQTVNACIPKAFWSPVVVVIEKPKCLAGWDSQIDIDRWGNIKCKLPNTSLEDCCYIVHPKSLLNHSLFDYTKSTEDYPQCESNIDCGPKMFCDYLVNKDREVSNRTGCFNITKRADTATKFLFDIGIRMCKSDDECGEFDCLDVTNETYGFCGTREFCQINVEAPAKKPLVPCLDDMDCVHLMNGMVGSAGLIPNAYCNKTGDFCCSGLLDVCFGGNLVRPLRKCEAGTMAGFETCNPDMGNGDLLGFCTDIGVCCEGPYEEPVVCPDGVHSLFIEPACHRGDSGYLECPQNIDNCTCVMGWPCPSIAANSLLVNFGRPFVGQIACDPSRPICKRAVNGYCHPVTHTIALYGRFFPDFFGFVETRKCQINSDCETNEVCVYYLEEGQCAAFPNPNFLENENDEEEEDGWAEWAVDLYRQTAYGIAIVWVCFRIYRFFEVRYFPNAYDQRIALEEAYEEMMMRRMEERHEEILENWRREKYGTRHTKQTCECVTSTETPSSLYSSELSEAEKRKKWTKTFRRGRGRRVMKQKKRMHQRRRNNKRARMEKSNEKHMRRSTQVFLKAFLYGAPLFIIIVFGFFFIPDVVSNAITAEIEELMKELKDIGQDAISGASNDKDEFLKALANGKVTIADYVSREEAMIIIPTLVMTALFLLAVHGDVGKFSEIFFEEYAQPNNQVYPTFGKYGFNEDNSLKLSIPPSYFSQTKYVHTGIKKATNSTRSCGEFGNEVCNARRNLTASTIIITDGSNWQLTSAPFGQRSPMYCQSRYYNFDENGYCRSDFTPFIKGNYMACHKVS